MSKITTHTDLLGRQSGPVFWDDSDLAGDDPEDPRPRCSRCTDAASVGPVCGTCARVLEENGIPRENW